MQPRRTTGEPVWWKKSGERVSRRRMLRFADKTAWFDRGMLENKEIRKKGKNETIYTLVNRYLHACWSCTKDANGVETLEKRMNAKFCTISGAKISRNCFTKTSMTLAYVIFSIRRASCPKIYQLACAN